MDYEPTPAVVKWVKRCTDICGTLGHDTETRRRALRQCNARYLQKLNLQGHARSRAEKTIWNLLK